MPTTNDAVDDDTLNVLEGSTFAVSAKTGDIRGGTDQGLFFNDTRFLSQYELTVEGVPWELLTSDEVDYFSAAIFLTNPELGAIKPHTLTLQRHRFVGDGMHDDIVLHNHNPEPVRLTVELAIACDFADLFEVKDASMNKEGTYSARHDPERLELDYRYDNQPFSAGTRITFTQQGELTPGGVRFEAEIPPDASWQTCVRVHVSSQERHYSPVRQCGDFATSERMAELVEQRWESAVPKIVSSCEMVQDVLRQSLVDLASLRLEAEIHGNEFFLPAAGLPWFMAIFGRDTLITSTQSLWVGSELAKGALTSLAALQGKTVDAFKDEEPGKILHELRFGELSVIGKMPQRPYYGSVDSTLLWLILLGEYWSSTRDADTCCALEDAAKRALSWMADFGDANHDGFIEYGTKSKKGLGNQGWKDSGNSVLFHDGSPAVHPISLCEVQGYAYAAKLTLAAVAREAWNEPELATSLEAEAASLKKAFNEAFWIPSRGGYYAMAIDGSGRQVDSMTSNMGQLLWTKIVPKDRADTLVTQLMSESMFTGWGIRTMSSKDAGFNPIEYHDGTVWPHDNSLIAAGLAAYGYYEEAQTLALALFEAARYSDNRLPETFAGYARTETQIPVRYPSACSPQAWATGTPFLLIWSLLCPSFEGDELVIAPHLPEEFGTLELSNVKVRGRTYDIVVRGCEGSVRQVHADAKTDS